MLQRLMQTCRQLARLAVKSARVRPSSALDVTTLEERATPAAAFSVALIDPPVMNVVADLPAAAMPSNGADAKPIVRIDLMPAAGSTKARAQEWNDMMDSDSGADNAGLAPKAPGQETPAPVDANAEDLALLEAEWALMQQTN